MENEVANVAGDSAPANDDLRSTIESAFSQHSEPKVNAGPEFQAETPEANGDRARDDRGRFTKAEQEAAEAAKLEPLKEVAEQAEKPAEEAPKAYAPPPGWSVASKAVFESLPDSVKADIAKREAEVSAGFEQYKGLGEFVQKARSHGMEPKQVIDNYQRAEEYLEKDFVGGVSWLCENYGIHPYQLAQALMGGMQQPDQMQQPGQVQQPLAYDPNHPLVQKVQSLEQMVTQKFEAERRTAIERETSAFFSDPAHKYAENVVDDMLTLINGARAEGRNMSLKEAYNAAVWLNPETRQQLLNEQLTARTKEQADKATKAAQDARKAAASVTGSPVPGASSKTAANPNKSLRDDILEAMSASRV